jgi:negative regulator of flagellin synthesis FlgM
MDVSSSGSVGGAVPIRPTFLSPSQSVSPSAPSGLEAPQDEVELSDAARMLDRIQSDPQVRAERLAEIRAAIVAGTYETPEKMALAIERLLSEISGP